jgi:hypothetical protein
MSKKREMTPKPPEAPVEAPAVAAVQTPTPTANPASEAKPCRPAWIVEHGGNLLRVECDILEDAVREWNARYGRSRAIPAKQMTISRG